MEVPEMAHDTNYSAIVERAGSSKGARELPESVASSVVKDAVEQSAVLSLARTLRMPSGTHRLPLLSALGEAYFLHGDASDTRGGAGDGGQNYKDSAVKSRTAPEWAHRTLVPDEIAVLVPVPDAWMDDSDVTWEEIRSEVSRAFAKKIDQSVLFGTGQAPASFGNGLVPDAVSAGNVVVEGSGTPEGSWGATGTDLALDVAALGELLDTKGVDLNAFTCERGLRWRLRRLRDAEGQPIMTTDLDGRTSLYGERLHLVGNGSWEPDYTVVAGDWSRLVVGIRQDLTFRIFDQAVLTDPSTGEVVYNAVEQDGKVLRAVMRIAYQVVDPVSPKTGNREYPFAVLSTESS